MGARCLRGAPNSSSSAFCGCKIATRPCGKYFEFVGDVPRHPSCLVSPRNPTLSRPSVAFKNNKDTR